MDLAKIRKKSLLTADKINPDCNLAVPTTTEPVQLVPGSIVATPLSGEVDVVQLEPLRTTSTIAETGLPAFTLVPTNNLKVPSSPLEAILSGRTAAGCDDESTLADDISKESTTVSSLEFLCFRVSDEIYGINIMDIKEIIKPREVTEVPRAPLFVSGVLSLRGTIIPILDMRIRLGMLRDLSTGKERVIVIKNNNSFSGLLVDEVIQVVQIQIDSIEPAPTVLDGIDRDFVSGIGRSEGRLVIILNLENISNINLY